jgi:hypothetical protein
MCHLDDPTLTEAAGAGHRGIHLVEKAEGIGCPLGTADFVIELERRAPGRKAAAAPKGEQLKLLE